MTEYFFRNKLNAREVKAEVRNKTTQNAVYHLVYELHDCMMFALSKRIWIDKCNTDDHYSRLL